MDTNSTHSNKNNVVDQIAIEDLYPALVKCFGTILCGYVIHIFIITKIILIDILATIERKKMAATTQLNQF